MDFPILLSLSFSLKSLLMLCLIWPVTTGCEVNYWGATCAGVCHCRDGPSVCSATDGRCVSGGCSRGYTDAPYCQTLCPLSTFGLDCAFVCRCPVGDDCDAVNGVCSSGSCLGGWDGASCLTRMPTFANPPNVSATFLDYVTVTWRPWTLGVDPGVGPVSEYKLQYRRQEGEEDVWHTADVVTVGTSPEPSLYTFSVNDLTPRTVYLFRVDVARSDVGKTRPYFPGPVTNPIKTCAAPSGLPNDVTAARTVGTDGLRHIVVHWRAPEAYATNCDSFSAHKLVLDYSFGYSRVQTIVSMPTVDFTFPDTLSNLSAQVHVEAINDAGLLGPSITAFLPVAPSGENVQLAEHVTVAPTPSASIEMRKRTDTRLDIAWPPLDTDVYTVSVSLERSFTTASRVGLVHQFITLSSPKITLHNLHPASLYSVLVTTKTVQQSFKSLFWTLPAQPPPPAPPRVLGVSNETVLLSLTPIAISTGPLSAYQIVIEKVNSQTAGRALEGSAKRVMSKRSTQTNEWFENLTNYTTAVRNGIDAYVTAELHEVRKETNFSVGDDEVYNGYRNVPLQPSTRYRIWCGLISRLDGVTRQTFVNVGGQGHNSNFTIETSSGPVGITGAVNGQDGEDAGLIVGLILFFLFLSAAAILLFVLFKKYPAAAEEVHRKWRAFRSAVIGQVSSARSGLQKTFEDKFLSTDRIDLDSTAPEIQVRIKTNNDDDYNMTKKTTGVLTHDLLSYYTQVCVDHRRLVSDEFHRLSGGSLSTTYVGTAAQNVNLNRSSEFIPFDRNRLKLVTENDGENDYINASLVSSEDKRFIVTQWPKKNTRNSFWQMLWNNKTSRLIALVNLDKDKASELQYWPSTGSQTYGNIRVEAMNQEHLAYYSVRSFQLTKSDMNEVRYLRQFQYRNWSRAGVPDGVIPFLEFLCRCHRNADISDVPVVQCMHGGGRSGVFVALTLLLLQGSRVGKVDIAKCVTQLRLERIGLVKTVPQYCFIHRGLVEAFSHAQTVIKRQKFRAHYDNLVYVVQGQQTKLAWEFQALQLHSAIHVDNPAGGPFQSPSKSTKTETHGIAELSLGTGMELTVHPADSYSATDMFLCLSSPSESQTGGFWGRLASSDCKCIIRLSDPDEREFPFWPDAGLTKTYNDVIVKHTATTYHSNLLLQRDLVVQPERTQRDPVHVALFQLSWADGAETPDVHGMLDLLDRAGGFGQRTDDLGSIAVTCRDGSRRCGVFVALWNLLQKIEAEGEVDVLRTAKHLRNQLPGALPSQEQYRFLYRTVKEYLRHDMRGGRRGGMATPSAGAGENLEKVRGTGQLQTPDKATNLVQAQDAGAKADQVGNVPLSKGAPLSGHLVQQRQVSPGGCHGDHSDASSTLSSCSPPVRQVHGSLQGLSQTSPQHRPHPYTSTPKDSLVWLAEASRRKTSTTEAPSMNAEGPETSSALPEGPAQLHVEDGMTPTRPRESIQRRYPGSEEKSAGSHQQQLTGASGNRTRGREIVNYSSGKQCHEHWDDINISTPERVGVGVQRGPARPSPSKRKTVRIEQISRTLPMVGGNRFYNT